MAQLEVLASQVQLLARTLRGRVGRLHEALHHLASITVALIAATPRDDATVAAWIAQEGFAIDPVGGFFAIPEHLARLRAGAAAGQRPDPGRDPMSFQWPPSRRDDPTTRMHMHALRNLGPDLQALLRRFPDIVWVYYQDDTNASVIAPALDSYTAIPPEFDWHGYHSFQAAEPNNNPNGEIRWSPPNIDYAGHGLILCASIPVVFEGRFIGVWSMDVPLDSLLRGALETPLEANGEHFIVDYDGNLIAHPVITSVIAKDSGSVYREHLRVLGGDFVGLDLAPWIAAGHGQAELVDGHGERVFVIVHAVVEIRWLVVAVFPVRQLMAARARSLQDALARVGRGDLSVRLHDEPGRGATNSTTSFTATT